MREQSTLVHAVAREMDANQAAEHIKQQTWHQMEVEREKAQDNGPTWVEDSHGNPAAQLSRGQEGCNA